MPIPIEQSPRVADAEAEAEEIVTPQPQPQSQAPPPPPEPQSDPRTLESDAPETWWGSMFEEIRFTKERLEKMEATIILLHAKCERMQADHQRQMNEQLNEMLELKKAIREGKVDIGGDGTMVITAQVLHVKKLPSAH